MKRGRGWRNISLGVVIFFDAWGMKAPSLSRSRSGTVRPRREWDICPASRSRSLSTLKNSSSFSDYFPSHATSTSPGLRCRLSQSWSMRGKAAHNLSSIGIDAECRAWSNRYAPLELLAIDKEITENIQQPSSETPLESASSRGVFSLVSSWTLQMRPGLSMMLHAYVRSCSSISSKRLVLPVSSPLPRRLTKLYIDSCWTSISLQLRPHLRRTDFLASRVR